MFAGAGTVCGRALGELINALRLLESFDMVMGVGQGNRNNRCSLNPGAQNLGNAEYRSGCRGRGPQYPNGPIREIALSSRIWTLSFIFRV